MAITKRSSSTLASASRTNSTVTAPSGSATGDYIVVSLLIGNSSSVTPTAPSGWTSIGSVSYSAPDPWTVNLYMYGKFFDGAASWTWTHSSATSQAFTSAYIGVDSSTPIDVTASTAFQNQVAVDGPATAVAPSITIVTAGAEGIVARGSWDGIAITPPAGWTEEYDAPVLWVGDRIWSTTGATGTILVPHGNSGPNPPRLPWGIINAALRPGSDAPVVTATGGVTLGGSASAITSLSRTATGGVTLAGTAAVSGGTVTRTASGTVTLGGSASQVTQLVRTASGGIILGGTAGQVVQLSRTASGGVVLSGTADVAGGSQTVTAEGGIVLGGTASVFVSFVRTATGTVTLDGDATPSVIQPVDATGTIVLGGTAQASTTGGVPIVSATGGVTLSGTAVASIAYVVTATGNVTLDGQAEVAGGAIIRTATGGLTLGGTPTFDGVRFIRTATGGIILGGTGEVATKIIVTALGVVVLGGSAINDSAVFEPIPNVRYLRPTTARKLTISFRRTLREGRP